MGKNISKYYRFVLITSLTVLTLSSCELFNTREPETPSTLNTEFLPSTSAEMLLDNFTMSVNNADQNNYIKCISSLSNGQTQEFEYLASGSATNLYSGLFASWNSGTETRNIKSIISSMSSNTKPVLVFVNSRWDNSSSDSVNYLADYQLSLDLKNSLITKHYVGSVYLTMYRESSGNWYIKRWLDIDTKSDSLKYTWSFLKAEFAN